MPSGRVRIAGDILQGLFIGMLIVVTVRQTEKFGFAYEMPGDLIQIALGTSLCLWLAVHLLILPKEAEAYLAWLYLGLSVLPLTLICAIVIW